MGVMLQGFHWYLPNEGIHWNRLKEKVRELSEAGFTAVWLPPACKAKRGFGGESTFTSPYIRSYSPDNGEVGYSVSFLYDLGEYDLLGGVKTKYGSKAEYIDAIKVFKENGIDCYADIVLNHRSRASGYKKVDVVACDPEDRTKQLFETSINFPYYEEPGGNQVWDESFFTAQDFTLDGKYYIGLLKGKSFDEHVSKERGNFDYVLGADVDLGSKKVQDELIKWISWFSAETKISGIRIDALKHMDYEFMHKFIKFGKENLGMNFAVGEVWDGDVGTLQYYVNLLQGQASLFDVSLHYRFYDASNLGSKYDLRNIFVDTLVEKDPVHAVTFVDNHDTQPGESLGSFVQDWFKEIAYAFILLRKEGYPCIFYGDYYGALYNSRNTGRGNTPTSLSAYKNKIDKMMKVRREIMDNSDAVRYDYLDQPNYVGWTYTIENSKKSFAVVLNNGMYEGYRWMHTGKNNTEYKDILENRQESIWTDENGWGFFKCNSGSVSVWVEA